MIYFSILLLFCASLGNGERISVCVESENNKCPSLNATYHVRRLPNISRVVRNSEEVDVHLAKGRHSLHDEPLSFSKVVTKLKIRGESSEYPSTVVCYNAGISFGNSTVNLANIVFKNCGCYQSIPREKPALIGLKFEGRESCALGNATLTLENVTIAHTNGTGVLARNFNVIIINCKFFNNSEGHAKVTFKNLKKQCAFVVNISGTSFRNGRSGGLEIYTPNKHVDLKINITHCNFSGNMGRYASHVEIEMNLGEVLFVNCTFSEGRGSYGVYLGTNVGKNVSAILSQCRFISNHNGGLAIVQVQHIELNNNWFYNNTGSGINITKHSTMQGKNLMTVISNTHFSNNSRALYLNLMSRYTNQSTQVIDCTFTSHKSSSVMHAVGNPSNYQSIKIRLQGLKFEKNHNTYRNCSAMLLQNLNDVFLEDLAFHNNNCTAIALVSSNIKVHKFLNLTKNEAISGGGLRLEKLPAQNISKIVLYENTKLNIIGNRANRYGGGIFIDQACNDSPDCFIKFGGTIPQSPVLNLIDNQAELGGDAIFGGCLHMNVSKEKWISLGECKSPSTIASYPTMLAFCKIGTSTCATNHTLKAYRGEQFSVFLMAVDDSCIPSIIDSVETKVKEYVGSGEAEIYEITKKHCNSYSLTVKANSKTDLVTMELFLQRLGLSHSSPTMLTVELQDCPVGFKLNEESEECCCNDLLASKGIQCTSSTHSLKVPPYTWIGRINGRGAINENCQYCQKERDITINESNASQRLCFSPNRAGVLCGQCIAGYSLQLGGYECADCSNSAYNGVLLIIGFSLIGIAVLILFLGLNLTVSTGLMSGMIFYSNIVHSNSDVFLPTNNDRNSSLDHVVRFLSTFQAWINLDFGIVTCFFDGYNTYISTWMEFVFPLYIWLLVLIIVLGSRYSKRISALTASNTVSVLATLLLLSYAKLLKTSLEAVSYTDAEYLNDSSKHRVWLLDGSIPYLQGKHIPLFLMSLLTTVTYILPFSLLILLGPLFQAKSHIRVFNWINKLKPFLDAFYGPYTRNYRYWPGMLIVARAAVLLTYAYYSLGDNPFKLNTVSVITAILLVSWMLMGKTQNTSLYQSNFLNCLELFFLTNLMIFSVASIYHSHITRNIKKQQILAIGMVGSTLVAFCGILTYQTVHIFSRYKEIQKLFQSITKGLKSRMKVIVGRDFRLPQNPPPSQSGSVSASFTHSSVEMAQFDNPNYILREPLLTT